MKDPKNLKIIATSFVIALFIVVVIFEFGRFFTVYITVAKKSPTTTTSQTPAEQLPGVLTDQEVTQLSSAVLPEAGVTLPITWNDLGQRMINDGVIDQEKFVDLFPQGLSDSEMALLTSKTNEPVVMTQQNSRFWLDMLWAFGLANKNDILENGEMTDTQYSGAENFASTGGWDLSVGKTMNHYSKHRYVNLTPEQQALVDRVSLNIYRPCCNNSTHFPDCNHGMAMLGLLELMAANNNVSEDDMYQVALQVNAYWFPQTYLDLAEYFQEQGTSWDKVDARQVLGKEFSSSTGYQQTKQQIKRAVRVEKSGGGCGA